MTEDKKNTPRFVNCKLELKLEAQSPMLHFQWEQSNATLRASEVKPKLDRFLLSKWKEEGKTPEELQSDDELKEVFVSGRQDSLNYKMDIRAGRYIPLKDESGKGRNLFPIYYGNMKEQKVAAILTNPTVTIVCFHSKLREKIENYIVEFFLVTNFGTMQNKGFGSFAPVQAGFKTRLDGRQKQEIARYLKNAAGASHCFAMSRQDVPGYKDDQVLDITRYYESVFKDIKNFYSMMKSGKNYKGDYKKSYIYQYFLDKKSDFINEKAWMKREKISPNVALPENRKYRCDFNEKKEARYVRALLGTGSTVSYFKEKKDGTKSNERLNITISHVSSEAGDTMERVSSPIFFKIVRNVIFIVAFPVPDELYGEEFEFERKGSIRERGAGGDMSKKGRISTPKREDFPASKDGTAGFDIQDFLKKYVDQYKSKFIKVEEF